MTNRTEYDVIISGGAMVGASFASALANSSLNVAVIEPQPIKPWPNNPAYDLRVVAINAASVNFFQAIGMWERIESKRVSPFREIRVWDESRRATVHFDSADVGEATLGYIIENSVVAAAGHECIAAAENIDVLPAKVQAVEYGGKDCRVSVSLDDGQVLGAQLLVGADGAQSPVRRLTGIETVNRDYRQKGVVTTISTSQPHQATSRQRFIRSGPLAFLPLADGSCSIVWTVDSERADELLALSEDAFIDALQSASDGMLGDILGITQRGAFPLRYQHNKRYIHEGLALMGDAAHVVHPMAGLGVNLGLADAAKLAELVLEAARLRQDVGEYSMLRRYERWSRSENRKVMQSIDVLKTLFSDVPKPVRAVRNLGMRMTNATPTAKNLIMRQAMGRSGNQPQMMRPIIS